MITQDAHKNLMYAAKISLQVIEPEVAGYEEIFGEIVVNKQAVWKAQFNMTHWRLIENFFADSLKPSCVVQIQLAAFALVNVHSQKQYASRNGRQRRQSANASPPSTRHTWKQFTLLPRP